VPLAELGRWQETLVDKTIYHKNLERVVYVFAETAGRTPAECVIDIQGDQKSYADAGPSTTEKERVGSGWVADREPPQRASGRTFLFHRDALPWALPDGIRVRFSGEGEWQITLDVFRDLGLAFAAALVGIYILLVTQTGSFVIPIVVMMAIPLTVIGIMPGFWLLNVLAGGQAGGYADPILFTATAMIGMIALAGIVTRQAIIIIDFVHLSLRRGHTLFDAILQSCVIRLRPILLTTGAAMLGAAPITIDPIFSGLAWALIFGLLASTVFTLFVIPVVYWLLYEKKPGHGLPVLGQAE
jgi:multidrug efflux pump subunit AcrB